MPNIYYFKLLLCLIISVLLLLGPYSDFISYAVMITSERQSFLWLLVCQNFILIKYAIIALCGLAILTHYFNSLLLVLITILFGVFNWFCSVDSPGGLYNYNTHLNFFMAGLTVIYFVNCYFPEKYFMAYHRFILFCKCYVLTFYLQSGLSKLIFSGPEWLLTGRTAWIFTLESGTDFGRTLAHYPVLFALGSFVIVAFELAIFPLYVLGWGRKSLVLGAIGLHLAVYWVMGISFWHLWLLYPVIFYTEFVQMFDSLKKALLFKALRLDKRQRPDRPLFRAAWIITAILFHRRDSLLESPGNSPSNWYRRSACQKSA